MRRRRVNGRQREEKEWEEGGNDWDNKTEPMKRKRK